MSSVELRVANVELRVRNVFSHNIFSQNIAHLEHTVSYVYNLMSYFLSVNHSKTEFLVMSQPTVHLPDDVILSPVDSVRSLGVICDSNRTFSDH